jgi:hypothetical protein
MGSLAGRALLQFLHVEPLEQVEHSGDSPVDRRADGRFGGLQGRHWGHVRRLAH